MAMPGRLVRRAGGGLGLGALIGGAAGVGVLSSLFDREGPWRGDIFPRAQEAITGDPNAIQSQAASAVIGNIIQDNRPDTTSPTNYYYGRPINPQMYMRRTGDSIGARNPVSGDVVFGSYNRRR